MNTPIIIGRQTFDGLGRQLEVDVGGHLTRFHYTNGQLAPSGNRLADGQTISFTYEKHLNHTLSSITGENETPTRMSYHPGSGLISTARAELGVQSYSYTPSGQALRDEWRVDGSTHATDWHYSFAGLLQGFKDSRDVMHRREFDPSGRVSKTSVGGIDTHYSYDALSRPISIEVFAPDTRQTLKTSIAYDALGREQTRTFTVTPSPGDDEVSARTMTQTLTYSPRDEITSRTWTDGEEQREETFEYDSRHRLVRYTANALAASADPYGNLIVEQVFTFNPLNGYQKVINTFADGSQDEATFRYAQDDPTRVVEISHSHASWPPTITLTYDACGRVISDSLGRNMEWDSQGRLTGVELNGSRCSYRYDPSGRLVDRMVDGALNRSFFSADQLTHEQTGDDRLQWIGDAGAVFAFSQTNAEVRDTTLVGSDAQGSVRLEAGADVRTRTYSAYGAAKPGDGTSPLGFAGERREPLTGWYLPGGHRAYDPVLMCFLAPDSESPFGRGGINPYAYCAGDPINRVDPDGHSWVNYAIAGTGLALAAIALIPGLQIALPAAGALFSATSTLSSAQIACLAAATLDVVSLTTGVASLALEISGHESSAAGILGGISLVTGLAGAGIGLKMHNLRRVGMQQRALDLKSGWSPPTPCRLGTSEMIFQSTSKAVDVGFIQTYHGTHRAALFTHSDPLRAVLMGPDGKIARAADIAGDFIAPRLKAMNYAADETFVLLTCWGGRNGAAMEIAKVLGRPVQGFTNKIYVKGFTHLQLKSSKANTPTEVIPYLERLRATGNPFVAWKTTFREAQSRLFHPDGSITSVL